jgi:hypothetical protein
MAQLQRVKAVFSEPRQAGDAFDTSIRRYYQAVDEGQGGLFMAVCRGKVRTEGVASAVSGDADAPHCCDTHNHDLYAQPSMPCQKASGRQWGDCFTRLCLWGKCVFCTGD